MAGAYYVVFVDGSTGCFSPLMLDDILMSNPETVASYSWEDPCPPGAEPEPEPEPEPPPPPPDYSYYLPFSVSVKNSSTKGGQAQAVTMEVWISAILGGVKVVRQVSDEEFGPLQTKSWNFNVYVDQAYFGQTMIIDVLVSRPEGGIVTSDSKSVIV